MRLLLNGEDLGTQWLPGLPSISPAGSLDWSAFLEGRDIPAGEHTLTVIIDPDNTIEESDEENNSYTATFLRREDGRAVATASTAQVEVRAPVAPAPLTMPNLAPGWVHGWDGPIIASAERGTFLDSALFPGNKVFVDVLASNLSTVDVPGGFAVDLYLDGALVKTFKFTGTTDGWSVVWQEDWPGLTTGRTIPNGLHTLTMVIDPGNAVREADETDNSYSKVFLWGASARPNSTPSSYDDESIRVRLEAIAGLMEMRVKAVDGGRDNAVSEIVDAADAGYYALTGRTMEDERAVPLLLSHEAFRAWVDAEFNDVFAISDTLDYPGVLAAREKIKQSALGYKTRGFEKV
ncbi:MAG: hypothetical protein FJ319_09580 [SAR202 cluster bacterium]|nr:hypothetical protein [SAR202 cluster bacterium]